MTDTLTDRAPTAAAEITSAAIDSFDACQDPRLREIMRNLVFHLHAFASEVKLTDSGRQVTGGGGITPDIDVPAPKLSKFEETLLRADVFFPYEAGVGGFTRFYLGTRPTITKNFEVDDTVLRDLRAYMSKRNVHYTEPEISENLDWIKRKIKQEVFLSAYGQAEGTKVQLESDPQVQKAVEAIPQARALYENARKIVAQRAGLAPAQP